MIKNIVFMFSGQGSQYYNMAKKLFDSDKAFRADMLDLDGLVSSIAGESVLEKLYDDSKKLSDTFDRTLYTHPVIFMVEYALAMLMIREGIKPDYVLGTSLGEFVSMAVSGAIAVEDALECVLEQAFLFEKHCQSGGMLAVFNNHAIFEQLPIMYENSELTSVNYNSHFVVSGSNEGLSAIEGHLKSQGITCQKLPVSFAFHSSLIDSAASKYKNFLLEKKQSKPNIPFVSCLYGDLVGELPKDYLWEIARKPIQFIKALEKLEKNNPNVYIDLGLGGTLSNFAKRNISKESKSAIFSIITPFNQELKYIKEIKEFCKQ